MTRPTPIEVDLSPSKTSPRGGLGSILRCAIPVLVSLTVAISCETTEDEAQPTPEVVPTLDSHPVDVRAHWDPMEGLGADSISTSPIYGHHYANLAVAEAQRTYESRDFSVFLPPEAVEVGATWAIPKDEAALFLTQFHPNVTARMNMDGSGAYGILRARSEDHWDILFRLHAQFVVADRMFYTPAQFAGRLLVDRTEGAVEYVTFSVPTDHALNIDLEVLTEDFKVGLAFTPRMDLIGGNPAGLKTATWLEEIEEAEARRRLSRRFFVFQDIQWVPLEHALDQAREIDKPIFALVIKGVLDDQSC